MPNLHVRRARADDIATVESLYRLLVPGDMNIRIDARRVCELQDNPENYLFVLEADGVVRGTAFLTICLDPMYGFLPYGVVENVIVEPTMRGAGGF